VQLVEISQAVQQAGQGVCRLLLGMMGPDLHFLGPRQECRDLMTPAR